MIGEEKDWRQGVEEHEKLWGGGGKVERRC